MIDFEDCALDRVAFIFAEVRFGYWGAFVNHESHSFYSGTGASRPVLLCTIA
jgi:hypothetical protein